MTKPPTGGMSDAMTVGEISPATLTRRPKPSKLELLKPESDDQGRYRGAQDSVVPHAHCDAGWGVATLVTGKRLLAELDDPENK
jgi:hypothetical protein